MQRLELEHGRELRSPAQLLVNNVSGDLGSKRQRESHKNEDSNEGGRSVNVRGVSSFALVLGGAEGKPRWPASQFSPANVEARSLAEHGVLVPNSEACVGKP